MRHYFVRLIGFATTLVMVSSCLSIEAQASVVEYRVTFDATWSQATHPQDFPAGAHFSRLIGGTHNDGVTFWQSGGLATQGIENMAELGGITTLSNEVNVAIGTGEAYSVLSGGGIFISPGSVSLTFEISDSHSLVTLVSMIAPSPDWFIGVSGLDLRDGNGVWRNNVVVNLAPYDAGTDSGTTFTSANANTHPQDPITNISNSFPFTGSPPLGTFTFELLTPAIPATGLPGLLMMALSVAVAGAFVMRKRA